MSDQLLLRVHSSGGGGGGDWSDQEVNFQTDDILSLISNEIQDDQINVSDQEIDFQSNDVFLLSLISNEIQDDQINVITEGLQLQKAIHSSWMIGDYSDGSGATNDDVNSIAAENFFSGISLAYAGDEPPPEEDDQVDWNQNNSSISVCESCAGQKKRDDEMVRVYECGHYLCEFCLNKYISAKVDSGECLIKCPAEKCPNFIQYDYCVATMLKYVLDKRGQLFPESMIPDLKSIPCPYKDCESGILKENLEGLKEVECLACHRFVCVKCYAPLHFADVECEELQRNSTGERTWKELLIMEALRSSIKTAD